MAPACVTGHITGSTFFSTHVEHNPILLMSKCDDCNNISDLYTNEPFLATAYPSNLNKLRSAYTPSSAEIKDIRRSLNQVESDLASYDAEIARLERRFAELSKKRDTLVRGADVGRALLAPVRRLPTELLSTILHLSLPVKWESMLTGMLPLVHLWVCTRWRNVALAMPELWSTIHIHSPPYYYNPGPALGAYLARSGESLLTVRLDLYSECDDHPNVELLVESSARWEHFALRLDPRQRSFHHLSAVEGNLPELIGLSISGIGISWGEPGDGCELSTFASAPKLRSLKLEHTKYNPSTLVLPWSQLTDIRIRYLTPSGFLRIIEQCPNLVFCHLVMTSCEDALPSVERVSTLTKLGTLKITIDTSEGLESTRSFDLAKVFNALTVPALETFGVNSWERGCSMVWPQESFLSMLSRSLCVVKTLHLSQLLLTDSELIECLEMMPSLSVLKLEETSSRQAAQFFTERLLLKLTPHPDETQYCLLPRLHKAYLSFTSLYFNTEILLNLVESRRQSDIAPEFVLTFITAGYDSNEIDRMETARTALKKIQGTGGCVRVPKSSDYIIPKSPFRILDVSG